MSETYLNVCTACGWRQEGKWASHSTVDCLKRQLAAMRAERDAGVETSDGLRAQIAAITAERDALKAKLDAVREWREEMVPDGCNCSDGYAKRQLVDPGCQWHDIDVERLDAILNDAREGGEG